MTRLIRDWRVLDSEQRLALGAAVALFFTMLLPWYQQNGFVKTKAEVRAESHNLSAFAAFSFVEAAVLVVAVAIAYLLFARAEGRRFNLPGSDGAVVFAAGIWTALLLVYRLFDKPSISHGAAANVGVQWGIFFALAAAGLLIYAGSRMRHAYRAASHTGAGPRVAPRERRSGGERRDAGPPPAPSAPPASADRPAARERGEELTAVQPARGAAADPPVERERPRYPPPPPSRQMSFDDSPAEPD